MTTYTPSNPQWSDSIDVTDTSTPNNGDLIAQAPKKLLDNDYVLAEADFNALYGLEAKTVVIGEDLSGNTHTTETNTTTGVVAVTTIVEDTVTESGHTYPRTTSTTVITTDDFIYTRTETIIERDETTDTILYTKEAVSS